MNVVPHTRTIRSRVIVTVDFDKVTCAGSDLQGNGNYVGLVGVILAATFACAGGIEITQRRETKCMCLSVPAHRMFESELGFTIGIGGIVGSGLINRLLLRFAIGGCGR